MAKVVQDLRQALLTRVESMTSLQPQDTIKLPLSEAVPKQKGAPALEVWFPKAEWQSVFGTPSSSLVVPYWTAALLSFFWAPRPAFSGVEANAWQLLRAYITQQSSVVLQDPAFAALRALLISDEIPTLAQFAPAEVFGARANKPLEAFLKFGNPILRKHLFSMPRETRLVARGEESAEMFLDGFYNAVLSHDIEMARWTAASLRLIPGLASAGVLAANRAKVGVVFSAVVSTYANTQNDLFLRLFFSTRLPGWESWAKAVASSLSGGVAAPVQANYIRASRLLVARSVLTPLVGVSAANSQALAEYLDQIHRTATFDEIVTASP